MKRHGRSEGLKKKGKEGKGNVSKDQPNAWCAVTSKALVGLILDRYITRAPKGEEVPVPENDKVVIFVDQL